jgi:uncharacterized protein (TIGR00730 family)
VADLGRSLATRGLGLVYGGASVGLMGMLADAVLAAGGEAVGVRPQRLVVAERAHAGLSALHIVEDMHQRKATMAALSDAFVAAPGGLGTLDELFEAWSWRRLSLHHKPLGLLNVGGFFDPLLSFLRGAGEAGFTDRAALDQVSVRDSADALLDALGELAGPSPVTEPPPRRPEPGAGICRSANLVAVRDGRLLAVRVGGRRLLSLPGGKPEPGEPPRHALARELREELGLIVAPATMRPRGIVEAATGSAQARVRMSCFSAPLPGDPVPAGEVDELRWIGVADRELCAPAARAVLDLLAGRDLVR